MLTLVSVKAFKASTLMAVNGFYTLSMLARVVLTGSWEKKQYFNITCITSLSLFEFKSHEK